LAQDRQRRRICGNFDLVEINQAINKFALAELLKIELTSLHPGRAHVSTLLLCYAGAAYKGARLKL
jgi:hypothetical protein